jgi:uncharacterized Ntn-hydrolase superfamily protein
MFLLLSAAAPSARAQEYDPDMLGTFSIIARDPATGELGMAVQSKAFGAGNRAMTIKGGVAVIAHQASANPMYGALGLELLGSGLTPQDALDFMLRADEGRSRQVAILDMQGRTAAWSGPETNDWKGHHCGTNYCAQGNILAGPEVVQAMVKSFESSSGALPERLMAALDAAQAAGGDARGMQSGAIVIAKPLAGSGGFSDRVLDIRVDDHKTPLVELRRLLNLWRSGQILSDANRRLTDGDVAGAVSTAQKAAELSPENDNAWVALAHMRLRARQQAGALEALRKAIELNPTNARRLPLNENFKSLRDHPEFRKLTGTAASQDPWYGTFSIVAVDPATGELGVGVQSRAFGAGAAVPYAMAGVGAVATQASANRQYGPKVIALLQQGLSPAEVVKRITDEDPGRDSRQMAVIDVKGRSAVYTGKRVIDRNSDPKDPVHLGGYAGHVTGAHFAAQGNTLASEEVVRAMAAAYEKGTGTMADRLMDALDAGQGKGGDTRGMQSAGLLVVRPIPAGSDSTVERVVDIRVDDAANPFVELRRLLQITKRVPAQHTERAAKLAAEGKFADAIAEQKLALAIQPHSDTLHYALAQRYAQAGERQQALASLAEAVRLHPNLRKQAAVDPIFVRLRGRRRLPAPPDHPLTLFCSVPALCRLCAGSVLALCQLCAGTEPKGGQEIRGVSVRNTLASPRWTSTRAGRSPARPSSRRRLAASATFFPSTSWITSPGRKPASAAGPSGSTFVTTRPSRALSTPNRRAVSGVSGCTESPAPPRFAASSVGVASAAADGSSPRVAVSVCSRPSRTTTILAFEPGFSAATWFRSELLSVTFTPSIEVITSPRSMPASSAGPSGWTELTSAPPMVGSRRLRATSAVTACTVTPSRPRCTRPSVTSDWKTFCAMFVGMANPMPMLPPDGDRICELMPTSSPRVFTSAPPELPWLIGASVCRKSSKLPSPSPVARPFALMIPIVTVCPTPIGLPTASTTSPTRTWSELPSGSTGKPLPLIFSTARSLGASVPTIFASNDRPSVSSTVISSAPSTTWWFVSTYPSALTMTPEPRPPSRRGCGCGRCGTRSPKKRWNKSSSANGNCCAARTRRSDRIVTTVGATFSTIAA